MLLRLINELREESRQWLENVDRTHLVMASGNPVGQKTFFAHYVCIMLVLQDAQLIKRDRKDKRKKAQLPMGLKLGIAQSVP